MNPSEIMRRPDGNFVSMKTMISHLKLLIPAALLTVIGACEKEAATDDLFKTIESYSQDANASTPDSLQFARIKEELDPEFNAMYGEFERLDPVKFKAWKADLKLYDTASSEASFEAITAYMDAEYKALKDQVMINLNFDKAQIRRRIEAILGNIPFELGPYLNVYGIQTLNGSSASTPQDTLFRLGSNFQLRRIDGCATSTSSVTGNGLDLTTNGPIAAWCNARAEVGNVFRVPERYRNMRAEFKIKTGGLKAFVGGLGGFSAEAKIFALLQPAGSQDGRTIKRQMGAVWSAAVAWGNTARLDLDGLGMTIAERCGVFEGDAEVLFVGETLVRSAGLGTSSSLVYINRVESIDVTFFN